jgi:hypothetical protein
VASSVNCGYAWIQDGGTYDGLLTRVNLIAAMFLQAGGTVNPGVLPSGNAMTVAAGSGMQVTVATGSVVCPAAGSDQGAYVFSLLTAATLTVETSDPANPRVDMVCANVIDTGESDGFAEVQIIAGTPASGATLGNLDGAPAAPSNSVVLAYVLVPADSASVTSGNIANVAPFTVAQGGVLPVAAADAPAGYTGAMIYDTTSGSFRHNPASGPVQAHVLPYAAVYEQASGAPSTSDSGTAVTVCSIPITTDGITEWEFRGQWPGFWSNADTAFYADVQLVLDDTIVGDVVVRNDASNDTGGGGGMMSAFTTPMYQQMLTDENAMSTALDRAQAAVQVAQAQEQLTQATQQATYTGQEYALQEKSGVAGSQTVVAAKEAVKVALYGVQDAAVQVAAAERNLAVTEENNAAQIKAAMLAVTEAQQQAAYQQSQDALAIQHAQQNVTNTYKEQGLEAAATASTSNSAANQFVKDMARLSPAARGFVNELLSMHGAWTKIEDIAQGAVMPGMTIFLKGIQGILPVIDLGVQQMGAAMGTAFGGFGKLMQTPAFKEGLAGLLANGVQFAQIVLPAFAQFIQQLGRVGGQKGAVTGLSNALAGVAHGLTGLVTGIAPYIGSINSLFGAIGKIVAAIGPPLATIVGLIARAVTPLTEFLNSKAGSPVVKVIGDIAAGMLVFKGMQKLLPLEAFSKLGGIIKDLPGSLGKLATGIGALPGQIAGVFPKIGGWFSELGGGIAKVGSSIGGLATSFAGFVSSMVGKLGEAVAATGAWIAEHAVAAASFIQ